MALNTLSTYGFVADPGSVRLSTGRQFDWAAVADSRKNSDDKKEVAAGTVVALQGDGKIVPRADTVSVSQLADDGSNGITATATGHGFATGDSIVIAGANEDRFNGTFTITVSDANTFTYTTTGDTEAGNATGTLVASPAAWGVLISTAREDAQEHAVSGYGVYLGGHLYENILPDSSGSPKVLPSAYKDEMGALFTFETYADSRLS